MEVTSLPIFDGVLFIIEWTHTEEIDSSLRFSFAFDGLINC